MRRKRILLVSPVFHGYWKAIQASFEAMDYEVTSHCYDSSHSMAAQIRNKMIHDVPAIRRWGKISGAMAAEAVDVLHSVKPDIVVVVKGDQLGPAWWEELNRLGIPRVTWLYDEVRRTNYTWDELVRIGPVASYSRLDSKRLNGLAIDSDYIPLAFDHRTRETPKRSNSATFIGARYPGRVQLLQALVASGVPVEVFGKSWSRNPLDIIRTHQWASSGIPAHGDLSRSEAYGLMAGCPATINIHGDQDGFTMRTFEASGVGGLQLIDRSDVTEFYEPGSEIIAFEDSQELVEQAQKAMLDSNWSNKIRTAARRKTLSEHTFDHRVRQLEDLWG